MNHPQSSNEKFFVRKGLKKRVGPSSLRSRREQIVLLWNKWTLSRVARFSLQLALEPAPGSHDYRHNSSASMLESVLLLLCVICRVGALGVFKPCTTPELQHHRSGPHCVARTSKTTQGFVQLTVHNEGQGQARAAAKDAKRCLVARHNVAPSDKPQETTTEQRRCVKRTASTETHRGQINCGTRSMKSVHTQG